MPDELLKIDASSWDCLFPFHFGFDRHLRVSRVGSAMKLIEPGFAMGEPVAEAIELTIPCFDWDFSELHTHHLNCRLMATTETHQIAFRGQLFCMQDELVYVGSPLPETAERLQGLNVNRGHFAPFDMSVEVLPDEPAACGATGGNSERERLSAIEQSLAHDLNAAGDIVMRISPDGQIIDARSSSGEYFDAPVSNLIGSNARHEIPDLFSAIERAIDQLDAGGHTTSMQYNLETSKGKFWFDGRLAQTLSSDYLLLARDVTEKRKLEIELEHRATHDPLTDLANRLTFEHRVQKELQRHTDFSLIFIDLDGFKDVNDTYGHQYGDQLLTATARRLRRTFHSDLVARLGGDEFGILISDNSSRQEIMHKCERAIELAARSITIDGHLLSVGLSMGVADMRTCQPRTAETLFKCADLAMYRAKSERRGVVYFENEMLAEYRQRKALLQEFTISIDEARIIAHYQPIIDLAKHRVSGMEALARWRHPTRGILPPNVFINLAEESGLIVEMGNQILQTACHDGFVLNAKNPDEAITVNVNISAPQLQCDSFPNYVERTLHDTGLEPQLLTLEITESILLKDFDKALDAITQLKALGIRIALDDFGTGHSSLVYLDTFPIDILKLDRSFVKQVNENADRKKRLIKSIIGLGNSLEMSIVAEGIEEVGQQNLVESYGCRFAQGYLYAAPMSMREMTEFVSCFNVNRQHNTSPVPGLSQPSPQINPQANSF